LADIVIIVVVVCLRLMSFAMLIPITNVDCFIQNGCEPLKRTPGHVGLR
ncbi:hypothetical protein T11_2791, partial [Trichinella zimbabwensis]